MTAEQYGREYKLHFRKTVGILFKSGAGTESEDFAQAGWLQGFRKLNQLHSESAVLPWVNRIALNEYIDACRSQHMRFVELSPTAHIYIETGTHNARIDAKNLTRICEPDDMELLVLKYVEGLTVEEIAEQKNICVIATRVRLFRARRRVRKLTQ